ncbi:hypothetical protein JZ751_020953 [Albula glossodonta]|uniref:Uncharacterized protein n=1 Tax=Albula glossodonta TaxID=121402 RepID=A0A8T2PJU3_9TELE|nr:hypothetical protein JZ751_020953 [Albula glossodonta]
MSLRSASEKHAEFLLVGKRVRGGSLCSSVNQVETALVVGVSTEGMGVVTYAGLKAEVDDVITLHCTPSVIKEGKRGQEGDWLYTEFQVMENDA